MHIQHQTELLESQNLLPRQPLLKTHRAQNAKTPIQISLQKPNLFSYSFPINYQAVYPRIFISNKYSCQGDTRLFVTMNSTHHQNFHLIHTTLPKLSHLLLEWGD